MKFIVAPDSFKGSLAATDAARAIAKGILRGCPGASVDIVPMADGGEGTVEALVAATGGRFARARVSDPLGRPIAARYGILGGGQTAVIEMAAASGLPLVSARERNPMLTTTFGTGELIVRAVRAGAREIILGIGGSATVDGGMGMAQALGVRFLDARGRTLRGEGQSLSKIRRIDMSGLTRELREVKITAASDVTNPLTGREGAARVYGPQKGATPCMVVKLERGLGNLARVIRRDLGVDVEQIPGAGAAGGLGAGLVAFLGARLARGVDIVIEATRFRQRVRSASLVLTGEGRVDSQSAWGKAVSGVAWAAAAAGVPCVVLAGSVGPGADKVLASGVTAIMPIARGPATEQELMSNAPELLVRAAEEVARLFEAARRNGRRSQRKVSR